MATARAVASRYKRASEVLHVAAAARAKRPRSRRGRSRRGGATLGRLAMADAYQPSLSHGHLPLDVTGLAMGAAVRQTARPDVGGVPPVL
jgi:hypothetical protein